MQSGVAATAAVTLESGRVAALEAGASHDSSARQAACAAFEAAVALAPDSPEPHAELGRCYAAADRGPAESIAALRRARELGAWSPSLDLELARVYLAAGHAERAQALLVPVSLAAHGSEVSKEARALLDALHAGAPR